jgi:penicillin-binding protein 2
VNVNSSSQIKDHWREKRLFTQRVIICVIFAAVLTGVVLARLIVLQIVDAEYYAAQSQGNRIRVQPLPPTRGLIYDRNGKILAENMPSYQLEVTPEQVPDMEDTLTRLARSRLLKAESLDDIRELIGRKRRFDSIPILQRMTDAEVARFAVLRPYFPGVEIRARLTRKYPYGAYASHALGYVGGISASDQQSLDPSEYAGTAHVGKVSIERSYEPELHGEVGHQDVLVNVHGRMMQVLDTDLSVPGKDLILSLDIDAQMAAENALQNKRGAVVAIDPSNGEIIVFASAPGFDPNKFISGLSQKEFRELQYNVDQPLFNRALQGKYPPGSTVKPIVALAGLQQNVITPNQTKFCRGYYTLPGHTHRYRDWKPAGHGIVDMHDAIAQSCDTYFYDLANETGIDQLAQTLMAFGLGNGTGIDISPESGGLVPTRDWKRRNFSKPENQIWFPGETLIAGIGQGYLLTTPLQLAHATATIASRGKRFRPTLVQGLRDPVTGVVSQRRPRELEPVELQDPGYWDDIINAMVGVMSDARGTARAVGRDAPWTIAGKSGTAQVFSVAQDETYNADELAERMKDHALFVAFAPVESPRIAVAVIVENGGSGSGVAAPVARKVMESYLKTSPEINQETNPEPTLETAQL